MCSIFTYLRFYQRLTANKSKCPKSKLKVPSLWIISFDLIVAFFQNIFPKFIYAFFDLVLFQNIIEDDQTEFIIELFDIFRIKIVNVEGYCIAFLI